MQLVSKEEFYKFIEVERLARGDSEIVSDEPLERETYWHRMGSDEGGYGATGKPLAKRFEGVFGKVEYYIDRE